MIHQLIERVFKRQRGDLATDKVVLVRRALPPDMVRRYGRAVVSLQDIKPDFSLLSRFHEAAGLEPYSLLTAFAKSPAFDAILRFTGGERVYAIVHRLVLPQPQRLSDAGGAFPFHQDGGVGDQRFIRAWILLSPESAGDVSPGVQFLAQPGAEPTWYPFDEQPVSREIRAIETSRTVVDELSQREKPWRPVVRLGDVLLFLGDTLHATYFPPQATQDRWSLWFTFVADTPAVAEQLTHDYAVFTRNQVLLPKPETIEGWQKTPRVSAPLSEGFFAVDVR